MVTFCFFKKNHCKSSSYLCLNGATPSSRKILSISSCSFQRSTVLWFSSKMTLTRLRLSRVAASLAKFCWRHACVALEVAVEVLAALEAESVGDFGDGYIG